MRLAPLFVLYVIVCAVAQPGADPVRDEPALLAAAERVRADPLRYARNLAANASRLLVFAPVRSRHPPLGHATYALFNGLLLVTVTWVGHVLWRRRASLPRETGPIGLFATLAVAVHLPVSASPRMLLPVVPALLWLVVVAVHVPSSR